MPVSRISTTNPASEPRRRRSSHLLYPVPTVKPGVYSPQHRIAFAPNVTPGTFIEPEYPTSTLLHAPASVLFPPSEKPVHPTRKRHPPGKRPSQGYIPRPPNAFMLFRADFVKQRHVPGSIETNHGSLSKIIGNCWRQLPLEEKHYWEQRAKEEKQQHKIRHPDYRFRPVHNKNKNKDTKNGPVVPGARRDKPHQTREEEIRCDTVAALLLEGKKGDELAQAVKDLDRAREAHLEGSASSRASLSSAMATPPPFSNPPLQMAPQHGSGLFLRRPSSVPLPGDTWIGGFGSNNILSTQAQYFNAASIGPPQAPYMASYRSVSPSPIAGISFAAQQHQYQERVLLRRPSSAQPVGILGRRSWTTMYGGYDTMPFFQDLGIENPFPHQNDQLPDTAETAGEPDYTLFNNFSFSQSNDTQLSVTTCTVADGSPSDTVNVGPHDIPPLNLTIEHAAWTPRDADPALDSAISLVSSSSTATSSSHESSPVPSDVYARDHTMFSGQNPIFMPTALDGNYNMNMSAFDISPLDISMPMGMEPPNPGYSFNATDMQGMMDGMENLSSVLHAPKPLLANERTPTKTMFVESGVEDYTVL